MPALLTSTSRPPTRSTTSATAASTDARSVTSQRIPVTPAGTPDGSTSSAATTAPRAVSSCATAKPMPAPPPVTAATSPSYSSAMRRPSRTWGKWSGAVGRRLAARRRGAVGRLDDGHRGEDVLDRRGQRGDRALEVALDDAHRADERVGEPRSREGHRAPALSEPVVGDALQPVLTAPGVVEQQAELRPHGARGALPLDEALLVPVAEVVVVVRRDHDADR